MESECSEVIEELRLVTQAKADSDSKRRKQDTVIQEYSAKLQDTERQRNDLQDKYTKSQVQRIYIYIYSFIFNNPCHALNC